MCLGRPDVQVGGKHLTQQQCYHLGRVLECTPTTHTNKYTVRKIPSLRLSLPISQMETSRRDERLHSDVEVSCL